jgi:hypothetical protein
VTKALEELPATLDETYERILTNIPKSDFDEARSILQWLAFSERPLTLQEVAEAAVLKPGDDPINPDERLYDASEVLRICYSLISSSIEKVKICGIWTQCDVVRFAHFSVKEYLMSVRVKGGLAKDFFISAELAHNHIGECCISYLLQMDQPDLSMQDLDDNPLLQYSAEYWFTHAMVIESGVVQIGTAKYRSDKLFSQDSIRSFLNWLRIYDPDGQWGTPQRLEKAISGFAPPLYYASMLGLQESTKRLLEKGADANAQGGGFGNALQAASGGGHEKIVQLLLEKGADVYAQGGGFGNALQAASWVGHDQIVQRLLEKGAVVSAQGGDFGNALQAASAEGHDQIVQRLLEKGADVNAQGGRYGNALQAALSKGHDQIVQRLLKKGAVQPP